MDGSKPSSSLTQGVAGGGTPTGSNKYLRVSKLVSPAPPTLASHSQPALGTPPSVSPHLWGLWFPRIQDRAQPYNKPGESRTLPI